MIEVTKRNGTREVLNLDKIHQILYFACDGITNVAVSEIELRAKLQFQQGVSTETIHNILTRSAAMLITKDTPNYQYVAGRLVNYNLRKKVYGQYEPVSFAEHVQNLVDKGIYDPAIFNMYSLEEINELGKFIKHKRDDKFTYAAMEQLVGKYLLQNRVTKEIYETPQMAYMMIAATLFGSYPKDTRISFVKRFYDAVSNFDISLPTPIMAGVRTNTRQFSSCVTISAGDSLDSIATANHAVIRYISRRAGIGINYGRIRAEGSEIRGGEAKHTGLIPFLKSVEASVKSCSQGGVRGGAATVFYPLWHLEFENLVVLKNNKGTEESRVRKLDHCFQLNRTMYERLINDQDITFFSPSDVPGLYDAFAQNTEHFSVLYKKYEADPTIRKKVMKAKDVFSSLMSERQQTGRVYIMHIDHVNDHGSFKPDVAPIEQSNLCVVPETLILTDKGHVTISDNVDKEVNVWNGKQFSTVTVKQTGTNQKIVKVLLDNDTNLECTEYHKFYVQSSTGITEKRASELQPNDKLETFFIPDEDNSVLVEHNVKVISVLDEGRVSDTYCFNEPLEHKGVFNGILTGQCMEIALPTKPLEHIDDENGVISLCTLAAVNWGNFKNPEDMQEACELSVRALDALLDYQDYPIIAAQRSTEGYRPLGVGIINFAYFLAKRGLRYDSGALDTVHEWTEAWSYYLLKASVKLAEEKGACTMLKNTKYGDGILPIDTYKKSVDSIVNVGLKQDWEALRKDLKEFGIRNATLMALMPSESSSQISNSTSGIDKIRSLVAFKNSKDGVLPQVVPEIEKLKNKYDMLWEQESNSGPIMIAAVMQKFIDQAISFNSNYVQSHYPDNKIPMKLLLDDLILAYKLGHKNWYYSNTNDGSGELDVSKMDIEATSLPNAPAAEDDCDSCKI